MERAEAEKQRDRMAAEHPDRATHSFILSERDGEWTVAKVALPPSAAPGGTAFGRRQPAHSHNPTDLPGNLPNHTAGL